VTDLVTAALDINKPLIFGSRWYSVLSVCLLPGYIGVETWYTQLAGYSDGGKGSRGLLRTDDDYW